MSKEVKIPQISEDADTGTVADIYVKEGDTIEKGQDLIGLESDKASVDVPSDASGKIKSIKVKEGDEVKVGDVILTLEDGGDSDEDDSEDDPGKEKKSDEAAEDKDESPQDSDKKEKKEKNSGDSDDEAEDEETEKSSKDDDSNEEEESDPEKKKEKESDDEDGAEEDEDDSDEEPEDKKKDSQKDDSKDKKESGPGREENGDEENEQEEDDGSPAAPLAKKFARELGINIEELQGGDPEKRITRDDVMAYAKKIITKKGKSSSAAGGGVEPIELPDFSRWGETERKPLSGIRSAVAKNTTLSWQNIPHVTHTDEADLTELHEFLEKTQQEDGEKLSMTAVITKIVVEALKRFPKFNASLDLPNKEIVFKKYFHISVAVDTENGLLMPVIKDVDKKPIIDLSRELGELAEKARQQELKSQEMKGGNFAISNLGGIGGTSFTPVIFPPQGAILGVSTSKTQAVFTDGKFEPREILPLSLSYDHRLIDGAEAARFLRWICEVIEQPFNLLTSV